MAPVRPPNNHRASLPQVSRETSLDSRDTPLRSVENPFTFTSSSTNVSPSSARQAPFLSRNEFDFTPPSLPMSSSPSPPTRQEPVRFFGRNEFVFNPQLSSTFSSRFPPTRQEPVRFFGRNEFDFNPQPSSTFSSPSPSTRQEPIRFFGSRAVSASQQPTNSFAANGSIGNLDQLHISEESGPSSNLQGPRPAIETRMRPRVPITPNKNNLTTRNIAARFVRGSSAPPIAPQNHPRNEPEQEVQPHDVSQEEPPEDAFNDPRLQSSLSATKTLVRNLRAVFGNIALDSQDDPGIRLLHQMVNLLATRQQAATHIVTFVGDSGVGKSSLLNCLLDKPRLVQTGSQGMACTCVVTEFHYHNLESFSIEAELIGEDELLEQLMTLLQSYRHHHLNQDNMDDDDERQFYTDQEKLADTTFRSMFPGPRLPDQAFLINAAENEVRDRFRILIADTMPREADMRKTNLTEEACARELQRLSSEVEPNTPVVWPYIRQIKVWLKAHILSQGLILADVPGLRDSNRARQQVTRRYLVQCDEIFAVCGIGRAATDDSLREVFELAKQNGLEDVDIICTKSDQDIDLERAVPDRGERRRLQAAYRRAKDNLDRLTSQRERMMMKTPEQTDMEAWTGLIRQEASAKKDCETQEFRLRSSLIKHRNNDVSSALRRRFGTGDAAGRPKIFCVSNSLYQEKRNHSADISEPYLKLSGVIDLRRYCISMMSNSQHRAALRLMEVDVPVLLSNLESWLQSATEAENTARRSTVTRTMDEIEDRLNSELLGRDSRARTVSETLRLKFTVNIYDRRDVSAWRIAAQEKEAEWARWSTSTYAAFCRKEGDHHTKAVGTHNWNQEIINRMVEDLNDPWNSLKEDIQSMRNDILTGTLQSTSQAIVSLEAALGNNLEAFVVLRDALGAHQRRLQQDVEMAFEQVERDLRILHADGLTASKTSIIADKMRPTYQACAWEKGDGVHQRRLDMMKEALENESLFHDIIIKLRDGFGNTADTLQERIETLTNSYLEQVKVSFELRRNENTTIENHGHSGIRDRVSEGLLRANNEMRRIRTQLAAHQADLQNEQPR